MGSSLYSKLICVLTLGQLAHLCILDRLVEPRDHDDIVLFRDLVQNFSPEDINNTIVEFIYWYKHNRNNEKEE